VINNCLTIVGELVKNPSYSTSPAGIEHCQFSLDHRSIQQEAGLNRQAYVRIQVVATGALSQLTREFVAGNVIQVSGFLNRHELRNGTAKLVLHALQLDKIN
jgi:primosomal replication protein N